MKLFQPDNFSQSEIRYKKYSGDFELFSAILRNYFKDCCVKDVYQLDRAEIQTQNYKVFLEDREGKKIILLKKYKVSDDVEQIKFYLDFLFRLKNNHHGLLVSRVLKSLDGNFVTKLGENFYSVFEFIDGQYFIPSKEALKEVAQSMAKMHLAFNEFGIEYIHEIDALSQRGYYPFNVIKKYSVQDLVSMKGKIKNSVNKEEIDEILLEKLSVFEVAALEVDQHRQDILNLSKGIIHSDFHPHNVLIENNKVRAILDFENVRLDYQARDVAYAIYRFGKQFFVNSGSNNGLEHSKLKDLFIESYSEIKSLSAQEIKLLPILVKDAFIRKLLFVLKGVYDDGNYMWKNDLPKFIVAIDEINYFWSDK